MANEAKSPTTMPVNRTYKSTLFIMLFQDKHNLLELYGTKLIRIPPPEFLIFYNGKEELPEQTVLNLSDMYETKDPHAGLELSAVMLNISGKHNQKLKEACTTLKEYAIYTDKVRKYAEETELPDAVEQAIQECIAEGVLQDFLEKHRAEAKEMSIFEYDQEKHMRQEREEAWADGRLSMIIQMLKNGMSAEDISRAAGATEEEIKKAKELSF